MKVFLTNPPGTQFIRGAGDRWPTTRPEKSKLVYRPFPFLLAYTAALLEKEGYSVDLRDCAENEWDRSTFCNHIEKYAPDLILFQTSTPSYHYDLETLNLLKTKINCPVMAVGLHAGAEPVRHIEDGFDYVCRGEYEFPTLELVKRMEKDHGMITDVRGIAARQDDKCVDNGYAEPADLDKLPWPARHLLPMDKYCEPFALGRNVWMMSTRGCVFNCPYCSLPGFSGKPTFRTRDPKDVCDEIEHIRKTYNIDDIYFDDASIAIDKKHITGLCHEMIKRNFNSSWTCMVGPQLSDELIELMAKSNCRGIKLGIESGSEDVLDEVSRNRSHNLNDVRRIIKKCHSLGIKVMGTFMLGIPGENEQRAKETIELMLSLNTDGCQTSIVTPFPGTGLYNTAKEKGWLTTDDWRLFDGHHALLSYPGYSNKDIERLYMQMVLRWERHLTLHKPNAIFRHLYGIYKRDGIIETFKATIWGLKRLAGVYD